MHVAFQERKRGVEPALVALIQLAPLDTARQPAQYLGEQPKEEHLLLVQGLTLIIRWIGMERGVVFHGMAVMGFSYGFRLQ